MFYNCVSCSRLTRKARVWGAALIILERLFSLERTMILLSQSWSRACLLILRLQPDLFSSNYQIVTLFLLQARLTKRPDTLDSFNDADVDDYSTQVCLCQVFFLSRYMFVKYLNVLAPRTMEGRARSLKTRATLSTLDSRWENH